MRGVCGDTNLVVRGNLVCKANQIERGGRDLPIQFAHSAESRKGIGGLICPALSLIVLTLLLAGCSTTHHSLDISEIAPGVYDGRKPHGDADFQALRAKGIKTIINIQTMTWDIEPERKHALKNGFGFVNVPITASPFGPREEKVQRLFETMAAATNQPVYVHCLLGRDRTGVLMALYRVYYENCSPEDAWAEMIHRGGFKSSWALVGFRMYFWRHCDPPKWVKQSPRSLRAELPRN